VDGEPILRKGLHFSYQREVLHMTDLEAMMRHWSEASDEALLEAAQRLDEFTDQGRSILLDEFRRRGLAVPARSTDADNGAPLAPAEEIEVWRGNGMVQADPILAVLRANGIPARTRGEAFGRIYGLTMDGLGEVGIIVPADRAEEARGLLAAGEEGSLAAADSDEDWDQDPPGC
jgi:Putative prokaryotic signal transducing protein